MSSYTRDEKFNIAKRHLIPKQLKKAGIPSEKFTTKISFTDKALWSLIDEYTRESGVRTLERTIASCIAKAVKEGMMKEVSRISITDKKLLTYLGAKKLKDIPKCCVFYRVNHQLNATYENTTIGK
jgi:ATP-dependent Lon protease